jgi:hypothetical protein
MKKIKINIDREKFSQEEIGQSMDFSKIISTLPATTKLFYKSPIFYATVFSIATIITVVVLKYTMQTEPPFINPPLKGVNIGYTEYTLPAKADTVLDYQTGSLIYVPKDAFLDKDGNAINENVILKYRELHDPADFFLSGIPMNYDSAGTTYFFESAGMADISAFDSKGNLLFANPKSPIRIGMASPQKDDRYNVYNLDSIARKWKFIAKDTSKYVSATIDTTHKQMDSLKQFSYTPVVKKVVEADTDNLIQKENINNVVEITQSLIVPKKANSGQYHFKISFSKKDFPEMAGYENVLFEVDSSDKEFKSQYASITWENVKLMNGAKENEYVVTFSKGTETHSFNVHPIFESNDYNAALIFYTKKFNNYKNAYLQKIDNEKKEQEKKKLEQKTLNEKRITEMNEASNMQMIWQQRLAAKMQTENIFFRTLQINNFGVWNCDCPATLPQGAKLIADFRDEKGNKLSLDKVYLVEKGKNAVFTYYGSSFNRFQYNPDAENILWAVTEDNKLAIFRSENFKALGKNISSYTFTLTITDKMFTDYKEVKTFLDI